MPVILQRSIGRRIGLVDAGAEHGDRPAAALQRCLVRGSVDARSQAGNDGDAHVDQRPGGGAADLQTTVRRGA